MTSAYQNDGSLILDQAVTLPEVLDILVVGGGPAGTATAFRAKELGLSALVIDHDDLLKRIRDYPKDKLILPDFGGGDKMRFPEAGELIAKLHFQPIDKDDICSDWRDLYRESSVPAQVGIELTGLERQEGIWKAIVFNHRTRESGAYLARHVVIAIGRGVPRRFDIPGQTDGVAYRLDDPDRYVDEPACVVGGGTSAAEAVIAISRAKVSAGNQTPVYWSYRGDKMPRVSKGLSDAFFDAYMGNGNIRFHPHSEPVGIVTGSDRSNYLSLRIDRKSPDGLPAETVHLEFRITQCIACIGEDLPEAFLGELGIQMVAVEAGKTPKKMMLVTSLLETQQPNVYLVGDLLSQTYLETDDFAASPDSFRKVKHRGNIKTSIRDGVFVVDVIQQKLEGRAEINVEIRDAAPVNEGAAEVSDRSAPALTEGSSESDAHVSGDVTEDTAYLTSLTPAGVEAGQFTLARGRPTTIGRTGCDVTFSQDTALSDQHASISLKGDAHYLRDDGSRSGTYLKIRAGHPVVAAPGSVLRVGRQILVVAGGAGQLAIVHYDASGQVMGRHELGAGTVVFGRPGGVRNPDVALDPQDRVLSRFHLSATAKGGAVEFEDFNSKNGSYLKLDGDRQLISGDVFRVGGQQLQVVFGDDLPEKVGSAAAPPPTPAAHAADLVPAPAAAPPPSDASAARPTLSVQGQDISGEIDPGQTILEWADERDVEVDSECWSGLCGCDPIRVVSGQEFLNAPGEKELKTLKRMGLDVAACRLACMVKVSGPVVVEVMQS